MAAATPSQGPASPRPAAWPALLLLGLLVAVAWRTWPTSAPEDPPAPVAPALRGRPTALAVAVPTAMRPEPVPATVVLPSAHDSEPGRAFPTLYLLHGAGADHTSWTDMTDVEELAEAYELIVVCPDGGKTSWYFDSPLDPTHQYETFTARELVEWVDATYRTLPSAERRAIAGYSMGGHGALFLAMRHPGVFGTAVSMSGGVDIRPFADQWDIAARIGAYERFPERWDALTVIEQVPRLRDGEIAIALDCGTDDFFLGVNRALHARLLEAGITHAYAERPGGHDWPYWRRAIRRQMAFVSERLNG